MNQVIKFYKIIFGVLKRSSENVRSRLANSRYPLFFLIETGDAERICVLCNEVCCDQNDVNQLGQTGADSINSIKRQGGSDLVVQSGQLVHKGCRIESLLKFEKDKQTRTSLSQKRKSLRLEGGLYNCNS